MGFKLDTSKLEGPNKEFINTMKGLMNSSGFKNQLNANLAKLKDPFITLQKNVSDGISDDKDSLVNTLKDFGKDVFNVLNIDPKSAFKEASGGVSSSSIVNGDSLKTLASGTFFSKRGLNPEALVPKSLDFSEDELSSNSISVDNLVGGLVPRDQSKKEVLSPLPSSISPSKEASGFNLDSIKKGDPKVKGFENFDNFFTSDAVGKKVTVTSGGNKGMEDTSFDTSPIAKKIKEVAGQFNLTSMMDNFNVAGFNNDIMDVTSIGDDFNMDMANMTDMSDLQTEFNMDDLSSIQDTSEFEMPDMNSMDMPDIDMPTMDDVDLGIDDGNAIDLGDFGGIPEINKEEVNPPLHSYIDNSHVDAYTNYESIFADSDAVKENGKIGNDNWGRPSVSEILDDMDNPDLSSMMDGIAKKFKIDW